jgi:putative transposase
MPGCTVGDPDAVSSEDLVNRQFTVEEPDRLWLTDITEHPAAEGTLYCTAVMDAYSRLIVGWSLAEHMRTEVVTDALGMAILRRHPVSQSTILRSNHGSQYQCHLVKPRRLVSLKPRASVESVGVSRLGGVC